MFINVLAKAIVCDLDDWNYLQRKVGLSMKLSVKFEVAQKVFVKFSRIKFHKNPFQKFTICSNVQTDREVLTCTPTTREL